MAVWACGRERFVCFLFVCNPRPVECETSHPEYECEKCKSELPDPLLRTAVPRHVLLECVSRHQDRQVVSILAAQQLIDVWRLGGQHRADLVRLLALQPVWRTCVASKAKLEVGAASDVGGNPGWANSRFSPAQKPAQNPPEPAQNPFKMPEGTLYLQ